MTRQLWCLWVYTNSNDPIITNEITAQWMFPWILIMMKCILSEMGYKPTIHNAATATSRSVTGTENGDHRRRRINTQTGICGIYKTSDNVIFERLCGSSESHLDFLTTYGTWHSFCMWTGLMTILPVVSTVTKATVTYLMPIVHVSHRPIGMGESLN